MPRPKGKAKGKAQPQKEPLPKKAAAPKPAPAQKAAAAKPSPTPAQQKPAATKPSPAAAQKAMAAAAKAEKEVASKAQGVQKGAGQRTATKQAVAAAAASNPVAASPQARALAAVGAKVAAVFPPAFGLLEAMRRRGTLPVAGLGALASAVSSASLAVSPAPGPRFTQPQAQPPAPQAPKAPGRTASAEKPPAAQREAPSKRKSPQAPPLPLPLQEAEGPKSKAARTRPSPPQAAAAPKQQPSSEAAPPPKRPVAAAGAAAGRGAAKKKPAPAVPAFSQTANSGNSDLEAFQTIRRIKLPPKRAQDNYDISDREEDSEAEEPDRSKKRVPTWSKDYLQLLQRQMDTDPDSVFSNNVPHVNLDLIFRDQDYLQRKQERPKRRRGSSGEWKQDRLGKQEVAEYKRKMGQIRRWSRQHQGQPAALGA